MKHWLNNLEKRTFFNPNWTNKEAASAVEKAYDALRTEGKTGLQSYVVNGETIMVAIKSDGTFDTAYGLHKLTVDYFRK